MSKTYSADEYARQAEAEESIAASYRLYPKTAHMYALRASALRIASKLTVENLVPVLADNCDKLVHRQAAAIIAALTDEEPKPSIASLRDEIVGVLRSAPRPEVILSNPIAYADWFFKIRSPLFTKLTGDEKEGGGHVSGS